MQDVKNSRSLNAFSGVQRVMFFLEKPSVAHNTSFGGWSRRGTRSSRSLWSEIHGRRHVSKSWMDPIAYKGTIHICFIDNLLLFCTYCVHTKTVHSM